MSIGGGTTQHTHSGAGQGGTNLPSHVPSGTIIHVAHDQDPGASVGDFLECNGQNVSRNTYANLFAKIGITWGAGDGATTFTLPDARRRSPVGAGGTGTATLDSVVGATGGEETHLNTASESGTETHAHTENMTNVAGTASSTARLQAGGTSGTQLYFPTPNSNGLTLGSALATASITGSSASAAHNTYHPAYVCGVWIKT